MHASGSPVRTTLVWHLFGATGSRAPQVPGPDQGGEPATGFPFRDYLVTEARLDRGPGVGQHPSAGQPLDH